MTCFLVHLRKESVVQKDTTYVGLDVHKDSISLAMLPRGEARVVEWKLVHEEAAVRKMVKKIRADRKSVV